MQSKRYSILLACLIFALTSSAHAEPMAKRHQLELKLGYWNQSSDVRTTVDTSGVTTSVGSSGGMGGLSYGYWLRENLALTIGLTALVADAETRIGTGGVQSATALVVPVLFTMKYYFPNSTLMSATRPYVKAAAGPYFGTQSSTNIGSSIAVEDRTEAAIGGQVGGGIDFILGRTVMLGVALGYNIMSDFDEPIGGSVNYGGLEFTIGVSVLMGRGQPSESNSS